MSTQKLDLEKIQQIADLFFRRLHQQLTDADQQELEIWLRQHPPEFRSRLTAMTDPAQIQSALQYLYRVDTPAALADTQKKMMAENSAVPLSYPPLLGKVRRWTAPYKYAAAAVTIAAIVGTTLLIRAHQRNAAAAIAQHTGNDAAPGGNKAILQLSDGSRIILDSAQDGNLAQQGAFKVIKLSDGQLSYQAAGPSGNASNNNPATAKEAVSFNTITTPRGGQYAVALPDGTKVWLNAASSLRFPTRFQDRERQVELSGEAYFEVAKDDQHPFTVKTSSMHIAVLGTAFDVEAYPDEPAQKATLLQGAVKVSAGQQQSLLQPGQQALTSNVKGNTLLISKTAKAADVIAWKNGLFLFKEDSIQTVMRQVARWYDVDVVYQGQGKIDQDFYGKIPRSVPASTLLKILETTGSVHFTIEGKKIIVSPGSAK